MIIRITGTDKQIDKSYDKIFSILDNESIGLLGKVTTEKEYMTPKGYVVVLSDSPDWDVLDKIKKVPNIKIIKESMKDSKKTKELIESESSTQDIISNLSEAFPTFRARDWSWEMKSYSGNSNDKMIYGTSPTEPSWIGFGWNSYDSELLAMYGDGHPKDFDIRDTEAFDSWDELVSFLKKKNINPDRSLLSKLEREVKSKMESVNENLSGDNFDYLTYSKWVPVEYTGNNPKIKGTKGMAAQDMGDTWSYFTDEEWKNISKSNFSGDDSWIVKKSELRKL